MFEVRVPSVALDIQSPSEEALDAGLPSVVTLVFVAGIQLPTGPLPPGAPPPVLPIARVLTDLPKEAALQIAESIRVEAEKLPDPPKPSDLVVPGANTNIDQVAENLGNFRPPTG